MIHFLSLDLKLECPLILSSHEHKDATGADIHRNLFYFFLLKFFELRTLNLRNLNTHRQSVFRIEIHLENSLGNQDYIFKFIERRFYHLKLETTIKYLYESGKFWSR